MLKRIPTALLLLLTPVLVVLSAPAWAAPDRVEICHIPPGNPDNLHTIIVSEHTVGTHLAHGDSLGACPSGCQLDAGLCDDNDLCTDDICNEDGTCSIITVSCDDTNDCTLDTCDPAVGCVNPGIVGQACDDGDVCTIQAECDAEGACLPVQQRPNCCRDDADCADNDLCTENETCNVDTGECMTDTVVCGESDACVSFECFPEVGCVTMVTNCDDANFCTDDSCDVASGCINEPTSAPPEVPEQSCSDELDNDCDGFIDCADSDEDSCGSDPACSSDDECCESLCDDICTNQQLGDWTGDFSCGVQEGGPEVGCDCIGGTAYQICDGG